ncbi:MAG: hypothetical protein IPL53_22585 [Ignavibacteria bacterium]|nr:hypothetical protein [Ignavibacteria bacterium]
MEQFSVRDQIVETVNKLFIYCDNKQWDKLKDEVLAEKLSIPKSEIPNSKLLKSISETGKS